MVRLVLGLIKGLIIGGGVGYGAHAAGMNGGFNWLTYGIIGVMVGLLVGRPIWSHLADKKSTVWTSVIKAIFGYAVGVGLYAIVAKAWGGFDITIAGEPENLYNLQYILGGAIGGIFGAWIEVDDAMPAESGKKG